MNLKSQQPSPNNVPVLQCHVLHSHKEGGAVILNEAHHQELALQQTVALRIHLLCCCRSLLITLALSLPLHVETDLILCSHAGENSKWYLSNQAALR